MAGEVRVRVEAASVKGFDIAAAAGHLQGTMEHRFPAVLGKDFAGGIDAVGPGIEHHEVEERAFGVVTKPFLGDDGSLAEYVTVDTGVGLATLLDGIDFRTGAALGLAGSAALDAVTAAQVQPGQTVLLVGATGGVGTQVVQLARQAGARVVATAAGDEAQAALIDLGADAAIDSRTDPATSLADLAGKIDTVFHLAGDAAPLVAALKPTGRLVSTLLMSPEALPTEGVSIFPVFANLSRDTLDRTAQNLLDGRSRVLTFGVFALDDAGAAFAAFADGTLGKVVVTPTPATQHVDHAADSVPS